MELPDEDEIFEAYLNKAVSEIGLLNERVRECHKCKLCKNGKPFTGAGYPLADFFLLKARVSEIEHEQGVAFAGVGADILTKAFEKLDMDMAHVYGTNVIKCYSQSSEIKTNEIGACLPYLRAEIEICQPRVILAMGTIPFLALKTVNRSLEEVEYQPGKVAKLRPDLHLLITCDLDAILSEESSKRRFWKDLQLSKSIIDKELVREESS